jgi:tripartite-type tricarboxylate transporter receptor subunit TctC
MKSLSGMAALVLGASLALCPPGGRAQAADAQAYPSRPLRFVVPFPPSGSNDIIARAMVGKLTDDLRQPVVVDNRGGANGIIDTDLTAKSPPDGHTFLIVGNGFTITPCVLQHRHRGAAS